MSNLPPQKLNNPVIDKTTRNRNLQDLHNKAIDQLDKLFISSLDEQRAAKSDKPSHEAWRGEVKALHEDVNVDLDMVLWKIGRREASMRRAEEMERLALQENMEVKKDIGGRST